MNLLQIHETIKAENAVLKAQMKFQKYDKELKDDLAKKYVLEIFQLNKEVNKRRAKLKEKR